jgi:hypothetical protein
MGPVAVYFSPVELALVTAEAAFCPPLGVVQFHVPSALPAIEIHLLVIRGDAENQVAEREQVVGVAAAICYGKVVSK